MERATDVANKLQQATQAPSTTQASEAPGPHAPGLLANVFGTTTSLLSAIVGVLLLLYLLLAAGDMFLQKLIRVMPLRRDKAAAVEVVHEAEMLVLRYLLVTLLINLGQGTLVALVLWLLKVPSPWLWGLFTVVLEFIPYLGAAIMIGLLTVVAFASFDGWLHILALPGSYLVITTIQNNIVSPIAYGQRLKLNPVAVLVGVLFWWFLWGIPGAFIAVPIIATLKILADRTEGLEAVGEFLGE